MRHASALSALASVLLVLALTPANSLASAHIVGQSGESRTSTTVGATWGNSVVIDAAVSEFGVWFVDESVGIAVGNGASIQRTGNGGGSWSPIVAPISSVFNDVMFPDANTGYIAAANGQVLKSTNAGANWNALSPGSGAGLTSIFFVNANTGWAAGTGGAVTRTTNGGTNWTTSFVSSAQDLDDVFFIDASTGWVVGKAGTIFKSTDGGATWNPETSGFPTVELTAVWFTSSTVGWACGGDRLLLKTTNGGTNWNQVTLPTTSQQSGLFDVMFADPDSGIVVGSGVNAYFTTNGGTTWTVANPDPSTGVWQAVHLTRPPGPVPNVTITVNSVPTGLTVNFDGAGNTTPFTKTFPSGESHTLATPTPQNGPAGTRYAFSAWSGGSTSTGSSIVISPTANTTFTANMTTQYQLTMTNVANGSTTPVEGTSFHNAGSTVNISASPAAGYSFSGWTGAGTGSYTGAINARTITMNNPITETAAFTINTITTTITTSPAGKQITVNGTARTAPFQLTQNANLAITLDVPSPQTVTSSERLVFTSWSDAGAKSHTIAPSTSQTFTATLGTEYFLDTGVAAGTGSMLPADGWFPAGSQQNTSVTPGAGFFFFLMTDGVTGAALSLDGRYTVDMTGPRSVRASFSNEIERAVTVNSTPPGRDFKVATLTFSQPKSFSWPNTVNLPLAAVTPQVQAGGLKRWVFDHWSDSGAASHNALPKSALTNIYTVTYKTQFPLTMATGANGTTTPPPGVAWTDSNTVVALTGVPNPGFRLLSWTGTGAGSYSGANNPQNITVRNPINETAAFELIPTLALTAPLRPTLLIAGETVHLTWNSNFGGNVKIELRDGPAGTPVAIAATTPNDGAFDWVPPDTPMSSLYLRISDAADGVPVDQVGPFTLCDPYFNIGPQPGALLSNAPEDLAVGDFNEDGILDLVVPNSAGFTLRFGQGTAGVGSAQFSAGTLTQLLSFVRAVELLDTNEDDRLDVVCGLDDGRVEISRGGGTGAVGNGTFAGGVFLTGGGNLRDIEPGDFNEDGRVDLLAADSTGQQLLFFAGNGANGVSNGAFAAAVPIPVGAMPTVVKAYDFTEDGILDLVVGTKGAAANDLVFFRGLGAGAWGNGTFTPAGTFGTTGDVEDIVIRDFDEDGRADLAYSSRNPDELRVLHGTGPNAQGAPGFSLVSALPLASGPHALAASDYNRDGRVDVAVTETGTPRVSIYEGTGTDATGDGGLQLLTRIASSLTGVPALLTEDLLEDNRPDLMMVSTGGSVVDTRAWTGDLALCEPAEGAVTLLAPSAAGATWNAGQELPISWDSASLVGAVNLELSRDNGVKWETIARGIVGNALHWTVTPPAAAQCLVRVSDSTMRNRQDVSDAPFAITATTVDAGDLLPTRPGISAAWPNPSSGGTHLTLSLPAASRASLAIYDLAGRLVRRLVEGPLEAGVHPIAWDGRTEAGGAAPAGVYFARARWTGFAGERRIVLIP